MADTQFGKLKNSDGIDIKAYDLGVGLNGREVYTEGAALLGWDSVGLQWLKVAVDTTGQLQTVGGTSTGGGGGGVAQTQVWGSGTAGTWTNVGYGTAVGTANVNMPVQVQAGTVTTVPSGTQSVSVAAGTVAVTQVTSPWVISGTTTTVPSGTGAVNVIQWGGSVVAVNAGTVGSAARVVQGVAGTLNTTQTSIGTAATLISSSNTSRIRMTIINNGTSAVYIGTGTGVTTVNGQYMPGIAGYPISLRYLGPVYGIVASGSNTVSYAEETS